MFRRATGSFSSDNDLGDAGGSRSTMNLDSLRKAFARYFEATSIVSTAAEKASKVGFSLADYFLVVIDPSVLLRIIIQSFMISPPIFEGGAVSRGERH